MVNPSNKKDKVAPNNKQQTLSRAKAAHCIGVMAGRLSDESDPPKFKVLRFGLFPMPHGF